MAYTIDDWKQAVDRCLKQRGRGVTCVQLDDTVMASAFASGVSPVAFAAQPQLPPKSAPPIVPPPPPAPDPHFAAMVQAAALARARQPAAVQNDPRYLVNTGHDVGCPSCGSTNVAPLGKPGSGFGAFGSIGFVLVASVVEAAIQNAQRTVWQCTYCQNKFQ